MSTIQSSIQLQDRMTPVLQSITNAMNLMYSSFSAAQVATDAGLSTASMDAARQAMANASAEVIQYREEVERAAQAKIPPPVQATPIWESVKTPQVFMSSGADRFAQEFRAADQVAQQLYQTQQRISQQARQTKVTPPGMLNDVAAVESRMQALALRVRQINNIPVDLRTDQVNRDLESLRGQLGQAVSVQNKLSDAMSRMDISAANAAYQQLNSVMDSAERNIRDNCTAQEQFNSSVCSGQGAAGGLESTIKRYAAVILSVATAGKSISIADEMTQTTARLDLMNDGLQTTQQLQEMIYQSAQRSRAAYNTTANIVAKLGQNAKSAFSSNAETILFAENLNKQFAIAGASQQEIASASLQLTQALGSGVLRGEELNAVFEAAPNIIQTVADYMDVPIGRVRELASKGAISADVVRNAMLSATDEINTQFDAMPVTFAQAANNIKNQALMMFQPALEQLSAVTQTEGFGALVDNITGAIQTIASGSVQALDLMGQAALWVQENWGTIEPVIWGVAAAVGFYALVMGGCAVATGIADLAAKGFFTTLLTNPLTWLAILIGMTVTAIVKWVQSVGGLRIAWMICVNSMKTKAEQLMLSFSTARMNIQNSIDNMQYGFANFKAGVLNALGSLRAKGLMILQNFVNGAIDAVNRLINAVNSIPGVAIKPISWVADFGSNAVMEEAATQQQRAADLAELDSQNRADKKARAVDNYWKKYEANQSRIRGEAAIEAAKNDAATEAAADDYSNYGGYTPDVLPYAGGAGGDIANNTGSTAANTAAMADSMAALDEDLKYMRDAAEQEIINRFTLAELKVDVNNNNTLKMQTDFDSVNRMLANVTSEILAAAAEGGHI